jgi:peptidoglycan/LPS O-acetylase OafA/YrhL
VLIQLAVVLPLVLLLFKRVQLSFGKVAVAAGATQLAVFLLQAWVIHAATPASMVLWYVPSVFLGVWIGMNLSEYRDFYARSWRYIWGAAAIGLALYLPMDFALAAGLGGNSLAFNSAFSLYSISMALGFFGLAPRIAEAPLGAGLALFGRVSLPMFLVHPAILVLMGGPKVAAVLGRLPVPALWTVLIVLALSYAIARLAMLVWLDVALFGQRLPRNSRPQTVVQTVAA